ncbi:MAG: class I SAM-dependent rRNA methyltransferase [Pseudomonadota bacterium]
MSDPRPADAPDAPATALERERAERSQKRPTLRLKPKAGRRFFEGAPWIYADEPVLDRRTRGVAAGAIARLEGADRAALGTVAVNLDSKIVARLLDRDPDAEIDAGWFAARLGAALDLRERLFSEPFYRLVHAEADGLPGLVIDRFGDALAVQPNAAWLETRRTALLAALDRVLNPRTIVWSGASRARALEGLPEEVRVLKGTLDGPIDAPMNGAIYRADLAAGQKTGLFYDHRPTHAFVARLSAGRRVLDVFSHVGGFGLAALAAGARSALAIDGSAAALALAAEGAERTGVAERFEARKGDAFDALRALQQAGERFDVVVCDPPAFAPHRSAREAGLRAYAKTARLGLAVTAPGGVFTLCSCSHAVSAEELAGLAADAVLRARRSARLLRSGGAGPDHPVHPHLPETAYLKTLTYQLGPEPLS